MEEGAEHSCPFRSWRASTPLPKCRSRTLLWATWPPGCPCTPCSTCGTLRLRTPQQNTRGVPGTSVKVGPTCSAPPCAFTLNYLRGSATDLAAGHSPRFLSEGQQALAWNVVGKTGRTVRGEGSMGALHILFSLQPGQKNVVTRQPGRRGTTCTERPTASCGWHWTAASACAFIPPATASRKVSSHLCLQPLLSWAEGCGLWAHSMRGKPPSGLHVPEHL